MKTLSNEINTIADEIEPLLLVGLSRAIGHPLHGNLLGLPVRAMHF